MFQSGDEVYCKRDDSDKWLGPGKVMFQYGKIVFVRHGSAYVRVSVNRLIKAGNCEENDHYSDIVKMLQKLVLKL